jgi:HAMP domain-containing protein
VDDPKKGLEVKANLLAKCQKCHPDASANFPDAWMSHYIPSPEKYPIVYYVNLFYKFLIPGVLVPMGILVVMDFSRMMINRFRKRRPVKHSVEKVKMHEKPNQPKVEQKAAEAEEVKAAETPVETEASEKSAPMETPIEIAAPSAGEPVEIPAAPESSNVALPAEKPADAESDQAAPPVEKPENSESSDEEAQDD